MYISLNEFLALAKKYQALGAPTQALLDEMRRGNFRVCDEVRLGNLLEFLNDLKYVHGCSEEVHNMAAAVERVLIQSSSSRKRISRCNALDSERRQQVDCVSCTA